MPGISNAINKRLTDSTGLSLATGVTGNITSVSFPVGGSIWNYWRGDNTFANPNAGVGRLISIRTFSTSGSGTYTATSGTTSILVECFGAGGGGGGAAATGAGQCSAGAGGGSGAYVRKYYAVAPTSCSYSVGAGGAAGVGAGNGGDGQSTTFNSGDMNALGGAGGGFGAATSSFLGCSSPGAGGQPGVGDNSDFKLSGRPGSPGCANGYSSEQSVSGAGGGCVGTLISGGGRAVLSNAAGVAGGVPGSGASGACNGASQAARNGAIGSVGRIVIWEYS